MSGTCHRLHKLVGEWTPLADCTQKFATRVAQAEWEEDYDMSDDEPDNEELEAMYQKALAEAPEDFEQRFRELMEMRREVCQQRVSR